jgi:hypothetical protein
MPVAQRFRIFQHLTGGWAAERQALLPLATAEDNFANHLAARGQQPVDRVTPGGVQVTWPEGAPR